MSSGIVGLITDFGWGPYAGIIASVASCLGATPIHIDHSVPAFSVEAGAYVALASYRWLPRGSGLSVVIDPGVGGPRRALALVTRNYYMVGPDNGVLYPAASEDGILDAYELDPEMVGETLRRRGKCRGALEWRLSSTFHGRDLFTPAAALLALGVDPESLGRRIDPNVISKLELDGYERGEGWIEARVVYIDRFGNIALSVRAEEPPVKGRVLIEASGSRAEGVVGRTFQDAPVGGFVVYINSFGFLEVAVNQGNAAKALHVSIGDKLRLTEV